MRFRALITLAPALAGSACSTKHTPPEEELVIPDACDGYDAGLLCIDGVALTCGQGDIVGKDHCKSQNLICDPRSGCEKCVPGQYTCTSDNTLQRCSDDGTSLRTEQKCPEGRWCSAEGCADLCAQAESDRSYIGCDYWAAFTLNSQLDPDFRPALVVGNPQLVPAHVTVTHAGRKVADVQVPAGSASTLKIPAHDSEPLRHAGGVSLLVKNAGYHVVSSVPVLVHQFNPLLFEVDESCAVQAPHQTDGKCNSFTNDASLLLPSHALSRADGGVSYLGVSRASFVVGGEHGGLDGLSGFLALIAVGDRPVHVNVTSSAHTLPAAEITVDGVVLAAPPDDGGLGADLGGAGADAGEPSDMDAGAAQDAGADPDAGSARDAGGGDAFHFGPMKPGDPAQTVILEPGDVFQLLTEVPSKCPSALGTSDDGETVCDPGKHYDLTGTRIDADGPLAVIGGHDCTYVPFDQVACDHLEETVFPLDTWGKQVIVGAVRGSKKANYRLRVLSGQDGNRIRFQPEVAAPVTLDRGAWTEVETAESVLVKGSKPLLVAQYLEGQGTVALDGDPSLTLAPPVEQFRSQYSFSSPATYTSNYVSVIVPDGTRLVLDGDSVIDGENVDIETIGGTGYTLVTIELQKAGAHELHSEDGRPIGISLYGYGAYTSYMLPGGLDLRHIVDIF
jgi:hypothetical protein